MKLNFNLKSNLRNWLNKEFNLQSWLSMLIICLITVGLFLSLVRVVTNAQSNYEVYLYEKQGLEVLQKENDDLKDQLAYYQSYEYKKLYARDYLRLAEPGEKLYKIVGDDKTYDTAGKTPDFFADGKFVSWWKDLL
jgi:cell division protein FtsB